MLNDTFTQCLNDLEESMKTVFKTLVDDAANKIIKELDTDKSEVLEWPEFKQSMALITKQQKSLMQIIRKAKEAKA